MLIFAAVIYVKTFSFEIIQMKFRRLTLLKLLYVSYNFDQVKFNFHSFFTLLNQLLQLLFRKTVGHQPKLIQIANLNQIGMFTFEIVVLWFDLVQLVDGWNPEVN